jgi:hypothetical protein
VAASAAFLRHVGMCCAVRDLAPGGSGDAGRLVAAWGLAEVLSRFGIGWPLTQQGSGGVGQTSVRSILSG